MFKNVILHNWWITLTTDVTKRILKTLNNLEKKTEDCDASYYLYYLEVMDDNHERQIVHSRIFL